MSIARVIGLPLFLLGSYVEGMNLYILFARYPVHVLRGGTRETFRYVSPGPVLGAVLLLLAELVLPRSSLTWVGAVLITLDLGSVLWLVLLLLWRSGND